MKNVSSASSLPAFDYIQPDSFILDFTTSSTNVTPGGSVCTDVDAAFAAGVSGFVNMECLGGAPDCDISASGSPPAAAAFDSDSGSPIVVHIAPDNAQSDQNITDHFTGDGGFVSNADVISVIDTAILVTAATGPDSGLTGDDNFAIVLDSPVDSFAPTATDDSSVVSIDANDFDVFLLSGLADSTADLEWSPLCSDAYPSGSGSIVSGNSFVALDSGALSAESALAAPSAALSSEFISNPNLTDIFGSGEVHDLAPLGALGEGSAPQSSPSVLSYGDLGQSPASMVQAASPVATGTSSSGLVINVTYDSSVASAPAGFEAVVASVVQFYESQFTNPVTLNIDVGWGEVAGQALLSGALGESQSNLEAFTYSQIKQVLSTVSSPPSVTNDTPIYLTLADATALGLFPSGGTVDGYVGFGSSYPFALNDSSGVSAGEYDLYGVVAHEISEVMGRISLQGSSLGYSALDLFRYSGPGGSYASANGGNMVLNYFNSNPSGDLGDWASSAGNDSYDAFSNSGVVNAVTPADLTVMNLIGYDVGTQQTLSPPTVTAQTQNQTWVQGHAVDLTLAANTFTDPQQETLTYSAMLASGAALPTWLQFNATTETFSGTVPSGAIGLNIEVTATDTSGLSASETFAVATPGAPSLLLQLLPGDTTLTIDADPSDTIFGPTIPNVTFTVNPPIVGEVATFNDTLTNDTIVLPYASTSATVISFGSVLYLHTSNGAVFELPTTSTGSYKLQFTDQTATVTFDNTSGLPSVNDTDIAAAGSQAAAQSGTGAVALPSQQLNLGQATQLNVDQGSIPGTPAALNETGVTFNGTAAAGTQSNVSITGFTAGDTLNLQGVHGGAGGVTFGATGASEYISYADTQGQPHEIQLIGFLSPGQDVYSVAGFNALNHGAITIA